MSLRTAPLPRLSPAVPPGAPPAKLRGRPGRSGTTIHGWPVAVFGMPFAGAGAFLVLFAVGLVGDATWGQNAPRWVLLAIGALFAIVGLLLMAHGASGVARRRRAERFRRKFPGQPWAWDHRWVVGGSADETGGEIIRSLMRRARFGRRTLHFARFPFLSGETLEASLDRRGALEAVPAITATLRCVQERYETRGAGRNRTQQVVCYELWSDTRTVEGAGQPSFDFTFPIPPDAQGTALGERPARYWELDVTSGDVPGVDFAATFLVPVYASRGPRTLATL
jgi:hypothetical protein